MTGSPEELMAHRGSVVDQDGAAKFSHIVVWILTTPSSESVARERQDILTSSKQEETGMGLLDKLMGHAAAGTNSAAIQRLLGEGEQILMAFKFMRDEIAVTNRGVFVIDVQGITGSKKEYRYFPIKGIKYVSYESAGSFDMDADIKIGVDGNSTIVNGVQHSIPLSFKIPKAQAAEGESFFKLVKNALDSRHQ